MSAYESIEQHGRLHIITNGFDCFVAAKVGYSSYTIMKNDGTVVRSRNLDTLAEHANKHLNLCVARSAAKAQQ